MRLITYVASGRVHIQLGYDDAVLPRANAVWQKVNAVLEPIIAQSGLDPARIPFLLSRSETDALQERIYGDGRWRQCVEQIISEQYNVPLALEKNLRAIEYPWWNEMVFGCELPFWLRDKDHERPLPQQIDYGDSHLSLFIANCFPVHSYVVMLQRHVTGFQGGKRATGVGGVVITQDKKWVMGRRTGGSRKLSIVPIGSTTWPSIGPAYMREQEGELGIGVADLVEDPEFAGIFENDDSRIGFAYLVRARLTFDELLVRWAQAPDKLEHSEIYGIDVSDRYAIPSLPYLERKYNAPFMRTSIGGLALGLARYFQDAGFLRGVFTNEAEIFGE